MGKRISDWLRRVSRGWVVLAALLIFLLFTALVLPQQAATAEQETGSADSPDTSFVYSPGDLYRMAESYGEQGRRAYVRARFSFDLVWPLVYTLFLATAISWLSRSFAPGSHWQRANLVPLLGALFDYLENLSTSLVMLRYPAQTPGVDLLAPAFTALKWTLIGGSLALLLGGIAAAAWHWMRRQVRGRNESGNSLIALPIVLLIGLAIAVTGSQGGASAFGIPVLALSVGLAFAIQWLAFIPAFLLQDESFFDLTGSLTYISVTAIAVLLSPVVDGRSILLLSLVVIWAARLGIFLFRRIRRTGKDARFDDIKPSFTRFLTTWTVQGLWVTFTLAAALAAITTTTRRELGPFAAIGFLVWLVGFGIEVTADAQKSRFRADPKNKGQYIDTGLWAWSRHPNYFGEIVLWVGVAIIALPVLRGWQWLTLLSPAFVALLITRISGVPLLEKRADEKWGGQEAYEAYKRQTPVLIPWPASWRRG